MATLASATSCFDGSATSSEAPSARVIAGSAERPMGPPPLCTATRQREGWVMHSNDMVPSPEVLLTPLRARQLALHVGSGARYALYGDFALATTEAVLARGSAVLQHRPGALGAIALDGFPNGAELADHDGRALRACVHGGRRSSSTGKRPQREAVCSRRLLPAGESTAVRSRLDPEQCMESRPRRPGGFV
jgi:hypothetical protein